MRAFDEARRLRQPAGSSKGGRFAARTHLANDEVSLSAPEEDFEELRVLEGDGMTLYVNQKGQVHRTDGPAITFADGTEHWYFEDLRHRDDGPAVTRPDGVEVYYHHGVKDRLDGPAVTLPDGTAIWYRDGKRLGAQPPH